MRRTLVFLLSVVAVGAASCSAHAQPGPDSSLRVVIIRHGEKPDTGDHLSCQGQNRALQLPAVLYRKFDVPAHVYVPSLGTDKFSTHVRMFETIIPFAVKYSVNINSEFDVNDYPAIAGKVLAKKGVVLLVWQHEAIPALAAQLGVADPPKWKNKDFDSIWIISYASGKAVLTIDHEGLSPSPDCSY